MQMAVMPWHIRKRLPFTDGCTDECAGWLQVDEAWNPKGTRVLLGCVRYERGCSFSSLCFQN